MKNILTVAALIFASIAGTAVAEDKVPAKYEIKIQKPAAKASAKAVAKIQVTPKGAYHMNKDFPTKLTLKTSDGVTLAKEKLTAKDDKDAVKIEKDAASFEISFTASSAGKKSFTGELKSAVCTETTCEPFTEAISFEVEVAAK